MTTMDKKSFNYYSNHHTKSFPEQKQLITYTFNDIQMAIVGIVEEKDNLIYLYEYRGKYVGIEFFISFSKQSTSYKLLTVSEAA